MASSYQVFFKNQPDQSFQSVPIDMPPNQLGLQMLVVDKQRHEHLGTLCLRFDRLDAEQPSVAHGSPVHAVGHVDGYRWIYPPIADAVVAVDDERILFQSVIAGPGHLGGALLDQAGHIIGLLQSNNGPVASAIPIDRVADWLQSTEVAVDLRAARYGLINPLAGAAEAWDVEEIQRLVRECHDVNVEGKKARTPLFHAVRQRDVHTASLLLEHGANTNDGNCLVLSQAVKHDDTKMVRLLLKHGAYPSQESTCKGAVRQAIFKTNGPLLEMLLQAHPIATMSETENRDLMRNFFLAVGRDWEEGVLMMLDNGVPIDVVNEYSGRTAVLEATENGLVSVIEQLLGSGASLNETDKEGQTALHLAAEGSTDRHALVMDRLIEAGADIEARNGRGETPLHRAFDLGRKVSAAYLLVACANPYAENRDGKLPMDLASQKDLEQIFHHLVTTGGYERQQQCGPALRLNLAKQVSNPG
jgi:ankyrin repeat protein